MKSLKEFTNLLVIYSLTDPITNEVKYVGRTFNAQRRLLAHIYDIRPKNNSEKFKWLRELRSINKKPIFKILEVVENESTGSEREEYWYKLLSQNNKLLNKEKTFKGGCNKHLTSQAKQHISLSNKASWLRKKMQNNIK